MTDRKIIVRTTRVTILPEGEPIFGETATHIKIEDEAAGEFLEIEQQSGHVGTNDQTIQVSPDEWPVLRGAIDRMMKEITDHEQP